MGKFVEITKFNIFFLLARYRNLCRIHITTKVALLQHCQNTLWRQRNPNFTAVSWNDVNSRQCFKSVLSKYFVLIGRKIFVCNQNPLQQQKRYFTAPKKTQWFFLLRQCICSEIPMMWTASEQKNLLQLCDVNTK